jgi:hypothetical protein
LRIFALIGAARSDRLCTIAANWSAQIQTNQQAVEASLSTETDQAIVSQDNNVRFEDTARVVELVSKLSLEQRWSSVNPYPEDTPKTLLERVVQLPDYAWNFAWTGAEVKLLTAFLTLSNIHMSVLGSFSESMYRFLQCGFKVTIRLNSTPFHQGCLCVTWCPDNYQTANVPGGILGYASMKNTVLLSASQQDQVTLDIPFFQLNPHYDLAFPAEWIDTRVNIKVLNPLLTSSSSVTDTVPVSMFIQMTNVHTYGILDPDALDQKRGDLAYAKANEPYVAPVRKTNFVKQSSKNRENKEGQEIDKKGVSAHGIAQVVSPILRSIPLVSNILDFGKSIFTNLDKPISDVGLTLTTPRQARGQNWLTGPAYADRLSSFPAAQVSKEIDMDSSDMNVTDYCAIPALFYSTSVVTKGVVLKVAVHPAIYTSTYRPVNYPDYLAFGSLFYRYYRGSIKYLFQFVGTPFYSCRFKISVVHSLGSPPGGTGNGTGFLSRIVDVKGDAWTSFVVPYLGRRMWSYTTTVADSVADTPWLVVEALTDVQGSSLPADATYYINIWRAAGPDFQLAMQTAWNGALTPSPGVVKEEPVRKIDFVKQSGLMKKWNEPTVGVKEESTGQRESGCYMADQATTITDMMKRYATMTPSGAGPYSFPSDWNTSTPHLSPIQLYSGSFLFWRGSRRVKFGASIEMYTAALHVSQVVHPLGNSFVPITEAAGGTFPVEVPWYCTELMYTTKIARNDYNPVNANTPVDVTTFSFGDMMIAAGDDFAYYYIVPPNPNAVQPTTVNLVPSLPHNEHKSNTSNVKDYQSCNSRNFEAISS